MASCFCVDPKNIYMETFMMFMASGFLIAVVAVSNMVNVYDTVGLTLIIVSCAFMIPALKVKKEVAVNFAVAATILCSLAAVWITVIEVSKVIALVNETNYLSEMMPTDVLVCSIGFCLTIGVITLAIKHWKYCKDLYSGERQGFIIVAITQRICSPQSLEPLVSNMENGQESRPRDAPPPYDAHV